MCKIITILNNKPENTDQINNLVRVNIPQLASQKDGYSVFNGEDTQFYLGESAYTYDAINAHTKYQGEPFFMIHFRMATAGDRGIDGLHMHPIDNRYIFAHNGTIRGFQAVKENNDSYYFAKRLIAKKSINEKTILKTIDKYGFWGKGFLWDSRDRALHVFCNTKMYIYALDNCIVMSTYELTRKMEVWNTETILGYPFLTEKETIKLPIKHKKEIDDTYLYFKDTTFQRSASIKPDYRNTVYSGNNRGTYKPYGQYYHENRDKVIANVRQELKEHTLYDVNGNPLPFPNVGYNGGGAWNDDTGDSDRGETGDTKENTLAVIE